MKLTNAIILKSLVGVFFILFSVFVGHATAQDCIQKPSGLIGWWPGDGNTDDIISGSDGSFVNGVTYVPGMVGKAFSFDGTEGLKVPDDHKLNPVNAISVSAWINRSFSTYASPIVKKAGDGASQPNGYALEYSSADQVNFWVYVAGVGWRTSGTYPVANNVWTHVVGTYNGTSLNLYVDGILRKSLGLPVGEIAPSGNPLYIGRDPCPSQIFVRSEIIDKTSCSCQSKIMIKTLRNLVLAPADSCPITLHALQYKNP